MARSALEKGAVFYCSFGTSVTLALAGKIYNSTHGLLLTKTNYFFIYKTNIVLFEIPRERIRAAAGGSQGITTVLHRRTARPYMLDNMPPCRTGRPYILDNMPPPSTGRPYILDNMPPPSTGRHYMLDNMPPPSTGRPYILDNMPPPSTGRPYIVKKLLPIRYKKQ